MAIYTDSLIANNSLLFISGQTPQLENSIPHSIDEQLDVVIEKIDAIILNNNATKLNIINMNIYITHKSYLPHVRNKSLIIWGRLKQQ